MTLRRLILTDRRSILIGVSLALAAVALTAGLTLVLPHQTGVDWYESFRPAADELLHGRDPYTQLYRNPPWTLLPILPLALLPPDAGRAAFVVMGLAGFVWFGYRMGAQPLILAAFLVSPPVLHSLVNANNDWMALLGFVLPPQIGLFFVLIKPQIGAAVALYWLVESWRTGRAREVIRVYWPVSLAFGLSFLIFGWWPRKFAGATDLWWNASLFPASIPVGLALIVASLRRRKVEYAMAASPCLSPYVLLHAWSGALAALIGAPFEFVAAWAGLWILVVIRVAGITFG
jgi:hypothetical protein